MNVSKLKKAIRLCRRSGITSFTWGHRGVGKSQSHAQVAKEDGIGFIDMRLSQCEASDLRGLPKAENGLTVYLPPADLPQGHAETDKCPACDPKFDAKKTPIRQRNFCKGILFLDELNRAEDDVLQAAFQLVLDRAVGDYQLPIGWSVHAAGNYSEGYQVNRFQDPAFINRFCHFDLSTTGDAALTDWVNYMTGKTGDNTIIQFCSFDPTRLDGAVKGERGFTVTPSRRSWEMVSRVLKVLEDKDGKDLEDVKLDVLTGLLGMEIATQFANFTCSITPQDILDNGITDANKTKLESICADAKVGRGQMLGLTWGIASNAKLRKTQKAVDHTYDFMEWIANNHNRDLAVSLGHAVMGYDFEGKNSEGKDNMRSLLTNPELAKLLLPRVLEQVTGPSWIATLMSRPKLHELMTRVAWYGVKASKPAEETDDKKTKAKKAK